MSLRLLLLVLLLFPTTIAQAADSEREEPFTILVLGDSLTAGYGLAKGEDFPAQLAGALAKKRFNVQVINGGISGDTSAGGLARLEWALADEPDMVMVELGANDALRGIDPSVTRKNLAAIIEKIQKRGMSVLLAGMKAPRNMGATYVEQFDRIYPELAKEYQVPLYSFFLEGVATKPELNQADGLHPTRQGVEQIVSRILPTVIEQILR